MDDICQNLKSFFPFLESLDSKPIDNTNNILDLETGSLRLSVSQNNKINFREDYQFSQIQKEYSKQCLEYLLPDEFIKTENVDRLIL